MALHNGIDTIAIATSGSYTETYVTATGGGNIASLFASFGFLESAPAPPSPSAWQGFIHWFWEFF